MRLIKSEAPQYQDLSGISTPVVREFRGVNTFDPLSIDDSYCTDLANVTTDDYPTAATRPGYTLLGLPYGTRVTGIAAFRGTRLVAAFNDGSWRVWTLSNTWSAPILSFSAADLNAPWTFTNFQGNWSEVNLVGTNGQGMYRFNGFTTVQITGAPSGPNFVTTYSNRLWCASGKELHASALDQGDTWNLFGGTEEDSYAKDIESTRGENINSLSAGLQKLTIGMPNSIVELYGSLPSDFYTVNVTEDEGTVNNRSVISQEGVLRYVHKTGLYEYGGGVLPDKGFSEAVKRYLSGITDQAAAAGSDGRRLYFTVATNTTLVFDPVLQTWTIWKGFTPTCFVVLSNELYVGDITGRVLKIGGTTDNGTAISSYLITKPFTGAAISQRQRWLKLWVSYEMAAGATLNIYLSQALSGDSDWTLVKTITGDGTPGVQRALVPVDKIALANYVRVKFAWTGWVRLHEYTRKQRALPLY